MQAQTTQELKNKIEVQVQRNEISLREAIDASDTTEAASLKTITSYAGEVVLPRTRDIVTAREPELPLINLTLNPDATMRVKDASNTMGLILTGKWITDYARLIKLEPEYEKTLASYRSQAELQVQLVTELEGVIGIKDKKIEILDEMQAAQARRGDLYKTMAEVNRVPWYEKVFHKLAFPVGLTLGTYLGVKIANNN